jgi:hypothetical protein
VAHALTRWQWAELAGAGPTQRFAVDGNVFDGKFFGNGRDPTLEALLESPGVDAIEDTFEGIVRRNLREIREKAA